MMTVNLKDGMPPAQVALGRMDSALSLARGARVPALKLIHGYGSTGRGGKIRAAVRKELRLLKDAGKIREFVPGERFSPFEEAGLRAVALCYALTKDEDYQNCNPGITVVIL